VSEKADSLKERLSNYRVNDNGCFIYQGSKDKKGYGKLSVYNGDAYHQKKTFFAHRVSYALFNNVDPLDKFVCHSCDNPSCINPEHLWLGSTDDNMKDMAVKGRAATQKGERNPSAKLTVSQVKQINRAIESGLNNKQIAQNFPVSHSMVSKIRVGKSWSHIE